MHLTDIKVQFRQWPCLLAVGRYTNGRPALELVHAENYEPVARATVNLPEWNPPSPKHTLIKDWSENEGMLQALTEQGIVEPTGDFVGTGFVHADEVILKVEVPQ